MKSLFMLSAVAFAIIKAATPAPPPPAPTPTPTPTPASTKVSQYTGLFQNCSNANYYYCSDGNCYTTTQASLTCSNNFSASMQNGIFPATYGNFSAIINYRNIVPVTFVPSNGSTWLMLQPGQSVRVNVTNPGDVAAQFNLQYNGASANNFNYSGGAGQYVSFMVWNNRLMQVFDVSRVGSVLIP